MVSPVPRAVNYAKWRAGRVQRSIQAARVVDETAAFLIRDARSHKTTGDYTIHGRRVRLVHGTQDISIFQEIFSEQFYALPTHVAKSLGKPQKIADIGGNIGIFALWTAIHWPHAHLVAFEPDPRNAAKYRHLLSDNNLEWDLVEACAMPSDGAVSFALGLQSESRVSEDDTGVWVPGVDVFPYLADVDLLKIDIEGSEWRLLLDDRFRTLPARVVLIEYHPNQCPGPDARAVAEQALEEAGYRTEPIFTDGTGVGMLRAYR